jgi:hypothetical protein
MVKAIFGVAMATLLSVACSSSMEPTSQINDIAYDLFGACRIREMAEGTGAVHIWDFPETIRVRQAKGRIIYEGWAGSWYENSWPILRLRSRGKSQKTYEVHGDVKGRFVLKHLPEGEYCFFASASCSGYHGYYGIIIIDKKADKKNEIEIELPWAVP